MDFSSKQLAEVLAGLGTAISPKGTAGQYLGQFATQLVQNESYANMLKGLIGSGAKATVDGTGMKLNVPNSVFSSILGGGGGSSASLLTPDITSKLSEDQSLMTLNTPQQTQSPALGGRPTLANPFDTDQQGFEFNPSKSDLAGLTVNDMTTLAKLALEKRSIDNQSYSSMIDAMYKKAQIENIPVQQELERAKIEKEAAQDKPFPIAGPGGNQVTLRQWQTFPEKVKDYLIAKHGAGLLGDDKFMSQREWEDTEPTERGRFINQIMKNPRMKKAAMELARAGATNISLDTKLAEKKAFSDLEGQLYFTDPKWTNDIQGYINSEDVQNRVFASENPAKIRTAETVKFVESKITGGGGVIKDVTLSADKKTMTWKVQWPSGDVKTVSANIR